MTRLRSSIAVLAGVLLLAGCVGAPSRPATGSRPPVAARPVPQPGQIAPPPAAMVRTPEMMSAPGLENIIGAPATALTRRLGEPRLDGFDGDVRKLQFAGASCVVDIYLYPLQPGAEPVATHVEARRRVGGAPVDRAQCLREVDRR
jgi:hypothetical protein